MLRSQVLSILLFVALAVAVHGVPRRGQTQAHSGPSHPEKTEENPHLTKNVNPEKPAHQLHPSHLGRPKDTHHPAPKTKEVQGVEPRKPTGQAQEAPWKICYYTNWSQYRPEPGTFWPEDLDPSLCTHIYYAFSDMFENKLVFYEVNDEELYARVNALKVQHQHLKTVLAVGGWTFGTAQMTLMLSSKSNRTEFILDVIQTLKDYNFNGIDLDFEYPGNRGSPPEDKYLFTCLCAEMREAIDTHNANNPDNQFSFTAGVAAGLSTIQTAYEINAISQYLDKVILMAYDLYGGFDNRTNPHTPLEPRPDMSFPDDQYKNVKSAVNTWLDGGCPRHKLVLGLATYGRGFTLLNENINGLEAPNRPRFEEGQSNPCNFTRTRGFCAYFELCRFFIPGATVTFDPFFKVPWGYNGDQWYGWEDLQSIGIKVDYLMEEQLGGFMVWTMDDDDFLGMFCNEGRYPMITEINRKLLGYTVNVPEANLPDPTYCEFRPDGYYEDKESCQRYYVCLNGQTEFGVCQEGTIYDPFFQGCRLPSEMDQTWLCNNCVDFCNRAACDA